jgi:type I restriction enzyme S subunit
VTAPIDVSPNDFAIVQHVLRRYVPDRDVVAFGSRATWTAKPSSDLDLAVLGETPIPPATMAAMKDAFDESSLPFKVDLVDWAATKDAFRQIIRRDQILLKSAEPTRVVEDWQEVPIGDIAEIFDGPHATPTKTAVGPVFLGISNLLNGRLDLATVEHLSIEDYGRWTRRVEPRAGDVVFSYETRLGEAARIPEGLECCLGRRMGLLRPKADRVDPRFLLYAFLGPDFQETIRSRTIHGSTVDRIPLVDLPQFLIRVPNSLSEQRAIAHVLGTLDDKIELNRRTSETLEAMARALFKSWFVDFDPVRTKAEGRDPGLPKAVADLFPARLVDSELGEIPEGWGTGSILEQARLLSGGIPKTEIPAYWDGDIPWASAKDVSQCGEAFLVWTERTITTTGLEESTTQIIPALSTLVVARGATTGRMALLGRDMAMNQTCYGLTTTTGTPFALHFRLRHEIDALVRSAHGSVFDTITTRTFSTSKVALVPPVLLKAFEGKVAPALQRVLQGASESRTLAALRDALLPKLISGELRVHDAKRLFT